MRSVIRWATRNGPAVNMLMIATLTVGLVSMLLLRRETFPNFELEIVLVTVAYPGASPEEIEQGICQKLEESVRSIDGIKKQTSVARESSGFLVLEIDPNVPDVQKLLSEVRSEVDRIPNFPPALAEEPSIQQLTFRSSAIKLGVLAPEAPLPSDPAKRAAVIESREIELRTVAEKVRDDLVSEKSISQAKILFPKPYQIDIEVSEHTLKQYGLSLAEVAQTVRRENIEMPGGSVRTDGGDILLRGKNKRLTGAEISQIEIIPRIGGGGITLGQLGQVRDGFEDTPAIHEINGRQALAISVERTADEDLFDVTDAAKDYLKKGNLPEGYEVIVWGDESLDVRDRINMLLSNGFTGLVLVFIALAIFLDMRLAFWVALGIPIAVLGAGAVLLVGGQTLNMLSMFAFLMALGIVVDDAIVIGENIYKHHEMGKPWTKAAIDGAYEVLPSVAASVATTIVAFCPLMFVAGIMGKFIGVMPVAIIAMLVISLVESILVLPCHLAHEKNLFMSFLQMMLYPLKPFLWVIQWVNGKASKFMDWVVENAYVPLLRWSLKNPLFVLAVAIFMMMMSVGLVKSGITPWDLFPKTDSRAIEASITFPDGTTSFDTDLATREVERALMRVDQEYQEEYGEPLVEVRYRTVGELSSAGPGPTESQSGGHLGKVAVQLTPPTDRKKTSDDVVDRWRELTPEIPGVETLVFGGVDFGPGGKAVEFKVLSDGDNFDQVKAAVEKFKEALRNYDGVVDVDDDDRVGKAEYRIRRNSRAKALGVTLADVSEAVRAAYRGDEVMRLQRGRHEVKLMVRYPEEDRRSVVDFGNVRVRLPDGTESPLTDLADIEDARGASAINRIDQMRSITVSADVEGEVKPDVVVKFIKKEVQPDIEAEFPNIRVRWEGQKEQQQESLGSLLFGFIIAIMVMYLLLAIEFRSYLQPLLILLIIPFGFVGAIAGHLVMGLSVSLFSVFGLVALTGVVVNDSIVLIDFINSRIRSGMPLNESLIEAGRRRFRPVLLTSVTTVCGLFPMLTERSFQAQILVPMATSLCFGLMLGTVMVLLLAPLFYMIYYRVLSLFGMQPGLEHEDDDEPVDHHTIWPQQTTPTPPAPLPEPPKKEPMVPELIPEEPYVETGGD